MGAEPLLSGHDTPPLILGLQPSALVDHVARVDWSLLSQIPGDPGGSFPVAIEELEHILTEVKSHFLSPSDDSSPVKTIAGGSVANTIRGLSAGFGITSGIIGACGDDQQGQLFVTNMSSNGINLYRLRMKNGPTAQCVCLVDALGNRTMRPCLSNAVKIQADEFTREDFKGSKYSIWRSFVRLSRLPNKRVFLFPWIWLVLRWCGTSDHPFYSYWSRGDIDLCIANEDEASELLRGEQNADPEAALEFLAKHCKWGVVTLGANGCISKHGKEIVRVPAIGEMKAVDATGAGDLFTRGFLYGLVKGLALEECCRIGSCCGGSVIRTLGGEVTPENWQWMCKQMQIKGLPVPDLCK